MNERDCNWDAWPRVGTATQGRVIKSQGLSYFSAQVYTSVIYGNSLSLFGIRRTHGKDSMTHKKVALQLEQ